MPNWLYSILYSIIYIAVGQSERFIEQRRRSLKRFLILICRHPTLRRDEVVRYFFTTVGQVSKMVDRLVGGNRVE